MYSVVCIHVLPSKWRPRVDIRCLSSVTPHLIFWVWVSHYTQSLLTGWTNWPTSSRYPCLNTLLLKCDLQKHAIVYSLFVHPGYLNSGLHNRPAGIFLTQPPSQPLRTVSVRFRAQPSSLTNRWEQKFQNLIMVGRETHLWDFWKGFLKAEGVVREPFCMSLAFGKQGDNWDSSCHLRV